MDLQTQLEYLVLFYFSGTKLSTYFLCEAVLMVQIG